MFYVIEITTGDATIAGKAIYEYDNLNAAIGAFHSKLGTAMKSELYASSLVTVIDANGAVYRSEKFNKE